MKNILLLSLAITLLLNGCFLRENTTIPPDVAPEERERVLREREQMKNSTEPDIPAESEETPQQEEVAENETDTTEPPENDDEDSPNERQIITEEDDSVITAQIPLITYEPYTERKRDEYLGQIPVAVFFFADWCPTCRKLDEEIKKNITSLPADAAILKADFDRETELKQRFEVTSQSTVVFLDQNGEIVAKVIDPSLEELRRFLSES